MKKVELFWNDNCGPCRALKPLMRELAAEAGFEPVSYTHLTLPTKA